MGPLFSQLGAQLGQLATQAGQFVAQELSKPHVHAHIAKAIGEFIEEVKKK